MDLCVASRFVQLLHFKIRFEKHVVAILIWRGLRDGLSVALALSLSATMHRDEFVLLPIWSSFSLFWCRGWLLKHSF